MCLKANFDLMDSMPVSGTLKTNFDLMDLKANFDLMDLKPSSGTLQYARPGCRVSPSRSEILPML